MRRNFIIKWSIGILLLFVVHNAAWAGIDPPVLQVLDGSKGQLTVGSVITVEDAKFFNPAYNSLLIKPYPVKNIVSLEINEDANIPMPGSFDTWVKVEITITKADLTTETVVTQLSNSYDTASYRNRQTYVFDNGYRVQVKILELKSGTDPNVWKVLKVVNQLQSAPQYNFDCSGNAVTAIYDSAWAPDTKSDELPVYWTPSTGADEYDLEWAYIDSSALASGRYGNPGAPEAALIFDNNASRVTITGTYYKIPLIYGDTGHLFFRVRPVQLLANGGRAEADWSSSFTNGLGKFDYNGHERMLNWQAATSFAEDGKRKTVVQYFDGSLRVRQIVTKDNSTENTIVAENFYDYQGRPVIQVMPAPTLNSVIGYSKNFNRGLNAAAGYDKSLFDTLISADSYCGLGAPPMDTSGGAAQYYSPANPLASTGFHKYIPDAKGFPFSETQYTQDNTGRISRQGGVGEPFRIGSGHETVYLYSTPDQRELDALFGTEVGHYSHYFKTAVRDANGQYSISYTDMHGRTVATALAGATPDSIRLDTLASYTTATRTESLSCPEATVIKGWVMESKKGLLVSKAGAHTFTYRLDSLTLQQEGCTQAQICYECLYDLQITITDDCNNQKLPGGLPFDTVVHNFQIGSIDTCGTSNSGGFSFSFTKFLPEGSYEVTKKLSVSRYALDYYRDSIYLKNNTCKNIDSFIQAQRQLYAGVLECRPTCQSCRANLGTWEQYRERFRQKSGIAENDMAAYENMALTAYNRAKEECDILCDSAVTEYDDIRRNMLMDMTPSSGQYANLDHDEDILSVFFSSADGKEPDTTALYRQVTDYRDENGNLDMVYDEAAGKLVPPQQLSPEVFAQKFKLSWAEALLPKHPEICKLQQYERLKASHEWDKRFAETDTYAEALAKGYLNPIRESSFPARFGFTGTDIKDPLDSAYHGKLMDSILHYRVVADGSISLWSVATITAMCKEGSNAGDCFNTYRQTSYAFNPDSMCAGELDMAWRAYRQMYLDIKRNIINRLWIKNGCNLSLSAAALMAKGYAPHFSDAEELNKATGNELPQDTAEARNEVAQQMADYYDANCRAYVTQWIQQLSSCTAYDPDSLANVIIPRLIQVCKEGSDADHPYGSSSVKPSSVYAFKSFEEVINNYNQTHEINDYIACNAYRITAPKPYNQQSVFGNKPVYSKPDSCECASIASYYDKFKNASEYSSFGDFLREVYSTNVPDSALNLLLGLCKVPGVSAATCDYVSSPLFLPPAFQCYTGDVCISCEQFKAADNDFRAKYPGIYPVDSIATDSTQIRINRLYEQFMNYRLGFDKRLDEYQAFARKCGLNTNLTADQLQQLAVTFNADRQQNYGVRTVFGTSTGGAYGNLHDIVRNGTIQLPDSIRAQPSWWYNNVEITTLGGHTFCMSNGMTLEFRMRFFENSFYGDIFYVNTQNLSCLFDRYTSGVYLISASAPHETNTPSFSPILADSNPNSILDWFTVKLKITPSRCYIYYNGNLLLDFPCDSNIPLRVVPNMVIGILGNKGNIDWIKVYDANDQLRYFEDYLDADHPALPDPAWLCPSGPDCQTSFVQYFNQQRGANYTFSQIDSMYSGLGLILNVCNNNAPGCDSLTTIYNDAVCLYNSLADPVVNTHQCNTYNWRVQGVLSSTNQFYATNELQTPGIINNGIIQMKYPDSSTYYGSVTYQTWREFRVSNEYAFEVRVKNVGGADVALFMSNASRDDVGYETDENFYVSFIPQSSTGFYNLRGVRHYDPALGGRDFNDWHVIRYGVKPDRFQVYYDGQLVKEVMRDGHSYIYRVTEPQVVFNIVGHPMQVDWMKVYGANDSLMFYENFDNYPAVLNRPDPRFLVPRQDCKEFFTQFFNSRTGKQFTYDQIKACYKTQCGYSINICDEGAYTLCGRAEPVFPPMTLEQIDNCSDTSFFIASKAQELYNVYIDSLKGHFDSGYIARCLEAYKAETFTVRHGVSEYHHTLYYYDQAGNLIKTVPPAGVRANYDSLWLDSVTAARSVGAIKVPNHQLVTQYRYNTLNQAVASQSPDGGLAEFWYDRLGRLAISRNARQKWNSTTEDNRLYSYTKYDVLGRITEVGQVSNTAANGPISNTITRNDGSLNAWLTALNIRRSQITATWYDAPFTGFTNVPDPSQLVVQRNLRNRVSYTYYADTGSYALYRTATFYTYDILGNVDTLLQDYGHSDGASIQNPMNQNGNRFKKIAYKYDLISGKVNMVLYQPGWSDQFLHRYSYDAENRLTLVETSTDSLVWERDARYEYYRHGPLARVVLGDQQVQGIDYAYTLQGWLKGINSTGGSVAHDMGSDGDTSGLNRYTATDAMGLTLNYFTGDYAPVNTGMSPFPGYSGVLDNAYRPLFNGNISSQSVYQKKFESSNPLIFYNYRYDQLNRLIGQDAYSGFNNNTWALNSMGETLKERIAYDANGNILKYLRKSINSAAADMDSLNYFYYAGTNRLRRITDNVPASAYTGYANDINGQGENNYVYDSIGNLVRDNAEGNTNIKWNVYGKIQEITKTATAAVPANWIIYRYDALGNRISQTVRVQPPGGSMNIYYTWYVRDAQGNILSTYTAEGTGSLNTLDLKQEDRYIYGSSRLGSYNLKIPVRNNGSGPVKLLSTATDTFYRGYKQYELTNHLGNVLAVISDKKFGVTSAGNSSLIDHYEPDIVSATDYYPFGMVSRVSLGSGKAYRFGFNGKENDNEVKGYGNQIDYGFRIYDPRVGRFLSVDPITREYPWYTPYQYAGNKPIWAVDLDGLEEAIPRLSITVPRLSNPSESTCLGCSVRSRTISAHLQVHQQKENLANLKKEYEAYRTNSQNIGKPLPPQYRQFLSESSTNTATLQQGGELGSNEYKLGKANFDTYGQYLPGPGDLSDGLTALDELTKGNYKSAGLAAFFLIPGTDVFKPVKALKGVGGELLQGYLKKFGNQAKHLTKLDVQGALKDIAGNPVIINGKVYDHLKEVTEALSGVGNQLDKLTKDINAGKFTDDVLEQAEKIRGTLQKQKDKLTDVLNEAKKKAQ